MILDAILSRMKTSESIRSFYSENVENADLRTRRQKIGICNIDDEPFAPQVNLSNYGYRIESIGDIKNIDEIQKYDIILCDIMGVGMNFDNKKQGASIISEVKRQHPEKIVVAYTGAALNQSAARDASIVADDVIKKDTDIEDWIVSLDRYSSQALDPYQVWQRIRVSLVQNGMATTQILKLENAYAHSILKKDKSFSALSSVANSSNLSKDVRPIIHGLVSSAAFHFILAL